MRLLTMIVVLSSYLYAQAPSHHVTLTWTATGFKGHALTFSVYRKLGTCPLITGQRIVQGLKNATFKDTSVLHGKTYCYAVTELDTVTGNESLKSNKIAATIP